MRPLALVFCLVSVVCPAVAETLAGVALPDRVELEDGSHLLLNGAGIRKATIFGIKVYVMGLYLEAKSSDGPAIIKSGGSKKIVMHFVRAVSADKLRGGWSDGFKKNCADLSAVESRLRQFNDAMEDVSAGDRIELQFADGRVDVLVRGKAKGSIVGVDFQQALLSVWLGGSPPNAALKKGLLGGK